MACWVAILTPALLVALFESVRHRYLISMVPMDVGNWLTAGLAFAASSAVVVGSLYSPLERLRDEAEERRRHLAVLEERDRIASALHDGICQSLFLPNVRLGKAEEALREHLDEFGRQTGLATEIVVEDGCDLPPATASQVVQIVREALWNVRKHAEAGRVTLRCLRRGEAIVVEVADDGRGFPVETARRNGRTFGLGIVEDRARAAGGWLRVESRPGGGTTVAVAVPVSGRAADRKGRGRAPVVFPGRAPEGA